MTRREVIAQAEAAWEAHKATLLPRNETNQDGHKTAYVNRALAAANLPDLSWRMRGGQYLTRDLVLEAAGADWDSDPHLQRHSRAGYVNQCLQTAGHPTLGHTANGPGVSSGKTLDPLRKWWNRED